MKTKNWIIVVLLVIIVGLLSTNVYFYYKATRLYTNNFLTIKKFNPDSLMQMNKNKDTATVIFIGNSITEQWSYYRPQFMANNNYINAGIGGQTTPLLLLRFRNDVVDLNPKIVVIGAGINDIAENSGVYNKKFTLDNIKSMAEIADANNIRVILTSVLPAKNIPWNYLIKNTPRKIKELNTELETYALHKGFGYANFYPLLVGNDDGLKPEYSVDGIHINEKAYEVMEPIVQKEISEILAKE